MLAAMLLMLSSAVITFFFINKNNKKISLMQQQAAELETRIRDDWYDAGQIYRNADAAIVISLLSRYQEGADVSELRGHYMHRLGYKEKNQAPPMKLLEYAEQAHRLKVDSINDAFLKKSTVESDVMELEHRNAFYVNLAFFLQILGLMLVLLNGELPEDL